MKTFNYIATWLLGAAMLFFGLNGFFQFMGTPEMAEVWTPFFEGIMSTGYIITFQNVSLILIGILLLTGRAVPFALVILAPFTVNWILLHAFLEPSTLLIPAVLGALNLYLGIVKFDAYKPMFK